MLRLIQADLATLGIASEYIRAKVLSVCREEIYPYERWGLTYFTATHKIKNGCEVLRLRLHTVLRKCRIWSTLFFAFLPDLTQVAV
jgi:hypothetical protein